MKHIIFIYTLLVISFASNLIYAQAPQKMSYQAVVRNSSNNLVSSSTIGIKVSLIKGSASGNAVFVETHNQTSNSNGLVTIEIGNGTTISGVFDTIDWANGPYFIKTETDITGGTNYSLTSTSQLMSVPYALFAENSAAWTIVQDTVFTNKRVGVGTSSPDGIIEVVTNSTSSNLILTGNGTNSGKISLGNNSSTGEYYYIASRNNGNLAIGNTITAASFDDCVTIKANGEVGIGTTNPERSLHVKDVMRLEPRNTPPASPSRGDIYYDGLLNKLRVFDGTTWQNCW
jgi:hypothetical protein